MKVGFDLKNLWLYGKGIGTFTLNLLNDLSSGPNQSETLIQLYSPSFDIDGLELIVGNQFQKINTSAFDKKAKFAKVKYDQITFLQSLKKHRSDVLFSPYF